MSFQRRRGQAIKFWGTHQITDKRGNPQREVDPSSMVQTRAVTVPERSQRAEVPGEVVVNVIKVLVPVLDVDVDVWSQAEYQDKTWDVISPPSLHYGTRASRHLSILLRERPS